MKTNFLKIGRFAFVAILAASGAFLTTSMQGSSKALSLKQGYIDSPSVACNIPVDCSTEISGQLCQAEGQQAFGKDNNCTEVLYRVEP